MCNKANQTHDEATFIVDLACFQVGVATSHVFKHYYIQNIFSPYKGKVNCTKHGSTVHYRLLQ